MTISLQPEHELFIQSQLETGRYQHPEEVISEAFRLLAEREARLGELRQKIAIGTEQIVNGQVVDGETVFARLQQKIANLPQSEL
jgi:antitoxin ParD1/3/4